MLAMISASDKTRLESQTKINLTPIFEALVLRDSLILATFAELARSSTQMLHLLLDLYVFYVHVHCCPII